MGKRHVSIIMICIGIGLLLTACPGGQNRGNWFTGETTDFGSTGIGPDSEPATQPPDDVGDTVPGLDGADKTDFADTTTTSAQTVCECPEAETEARCTRASSRRTVSAGERDTTLRLMRDVRDGTYETTGVVTRMYAAGQTITFGTLVSGTTIVLVQEDDRKTIQVETDDGAESVMVQFPSGGLFYNIVFADDIRLTKTEDTSGNAEVVLFNAQLANVAVVIGEVENERVTVKSGDKITTVSPKVMSVANTVSLEELEKVRVGSTTTVRAEDGTTVTLSTEVIEEIGAFSEDELMILKFLGGGVQTTAEEASTPVQRTLTPIPVPGR